jgi:hypothetical protein
MTDFVMQISEVGQNAESVSKAMSHVNLPCTFIAELGAKPFAECWGILPDIDRYIEYLPPHYREYLSLRFPLGKM